MTDINITITGLILPFAGTLLGAAMVFFLRKEMHGTLQKFLLGFASGVMLAASVWSLLIPAIDMVSEENVGMVDAVGVAIAFLGGIAFLLILDVLIPHLHMGSKEPEGKKSKLSESMMLMLAVTLHNIPEGMAVGVVFASFLTGNSGLTAAAAITLSIGIAIQNFPEGAIISMPMVGTGISKKRAFGYGAISGVVEPIFALLTILLTSLITPILPYLLALAAGSMVYVVVEELIPSAQTDKHSNACVIGCGIGFALMMVLDIVLG